MNIHNLKHLDELIEGEVLTDELSRQLYSTDASVYQELPLAIIRPKSKDDCIKIVKFASHHKIPLIFRTAGTSIAGQVVGSGVIVDVSRYMTEILSDPQGNTIRVQPGVILDELNKFLNANDLKFAIDISTSNRCMIGGMIGNNAAGSHSVIYKTTREYILELNVVLSDGSDVIFSALDNQQLTEKLKLNTLEGDIYRTVFNLIETNRKKNIRYFPTP